MCLILFAWKVESTQPLLVLANRDEYFDRPTLPLHAWQDQPLYAGKDLAAGGTWLGAQADGRWAALTNFRQPDAHRPDAPSRGQLTTDYLASDIEPERYLLRLQAHAADYNGFNLLVGDREQLFYYSNRENEIRRVAPGIYGLSNHLLDTPWPKVEQGKQRLQQALLHAAEDAQLFAIMQDAEHAAAEALPDTGVGERMERLLSPRFIHIPQAAYGTRSTTLLRYGLTSAEMKELSYEKGAPAGAPLGLHWSFSGGKDYSAV